MVKFTIPVLLLFLVNSVVLSQEPSVHAIFVLDTNSDVGSFVRIDKHNALRAIHGGFRDANQLHRFSYVVLDGQNATPQNVIQTIRNLRPGPQDTVFFYYAGHGATEQGRGHFLKMCAGRLFRSTLRQEIERHNVRQKIIMTESCSNIIPSMHMAMKPGSNTGDWDTLEQLFFSGSGTVDVNSCKPGQVARAGGGTGALWTHCLSDVLCNGRSNETVTWQSILSAASAKLERFVSPRSQAICVYSMGEESGGVPVQHHSQPASNPQFASAPMQFPQTPLPPPPPTFRGQSGEWQGGSAAEPSGRSTRICIYPQHMQP